MDIGVPENPILHQKRKITGGETKAIKDLVIRLDVEEASFRRGIVRPSQNKPDLLGPPLSLSAAISLGAISVRLSVKDFIHFLLLNLNLLLKYCMCYWKIQKNFRNYNKDEKDKSSPRAGITGQLIWREYFYTMSQKNPNFDKEADNPLCLQIPWNEDNQLFNKWKNGLTGYPFIDAGMRQLNQEGEISIYRLRYNSPNFIAAKLHPHQGGYITLCAVL